MDKIIIGPLKIPRLEVFGIEITPEITLLPEITVFDPDWIVEKVEGMADWIGKVAHGVVESMIPNIIQAVFYSVEPYLDKLAEDYYARRGQEKT